jgi:hypothetical protein
MSDPVAAYFEAAFVAAVPGFAACRPGDPDLLGRARDAALGVLETVQALPRDHWVWQPGYAVQTVNGHRIADYLRFRERHDGEDSSDPVLLWFCVAEALANGEGAFPAGAFARLHERDPAGFDLRWPIHCATIAQFLAGDGVRFGLGRFLRERGVLEAAEPLFAALRERRDPYVEAFGIEELTREAAAQSLEEALRDDG